MSAFDRYFHGRYYALRPFLFGKLFLVMVALDTWMLMIGHAGRYGVAGFNVAHFGWLDHIAPLPGPALYVGVLLAAGLLALSVALFGHNPWAMALLLVLYTYSWTMSMLDSYQHHYFVSWVMLCMVFFPRSTLRDVLALAASEDKPAARLTTGFGYPLLALTVTVLYMFTALAKMDPQWCQGYTLQRISRAGQIFAPLLAQTHARGLPDQTFWSVLSTSVIPVELAIGIGYALCVVQDSASGLWRRWLPRIGLITLFFSISVHGGAEALGLDIGWFSYYMFALAFSFLLPRRAVELLCDALAHALLPRWKRLDDSRAAVSGTRTFETVVLTVAACGALAATAYLIDLPGALTMALWAIVSLLGVVTFFQTRQRSSEARKAASALGLSAVLMWAAIARSEVRWDYYRFLGGDLQRRGESRAALAAYVKGERYAPKGSSRRDRIEKLQRDLGRDP